MNVVGDKGVIELNLFDQRFDLYSSSRHSVVGYGSNLDDLILDEFVSAILSGRAPRTSGEDGLRASRVALAAYQSVLVGLPQVVQA